MIKAIIFDYGGIFTPTARFKDFCTDYISKRHNINPDKLHEVLIENWSKAKVSEIKSELFWKNVADFCNIDKDYLRKTLINYLGFRPEMLILAKKLKKKYKLGLLSNHIEDWLEEIIENHKLDQVFDVIVTSYGSKIAKPDIRIFKEIVEKLKIKPEECIYIDDFDTNIPPAKELGMKTILFKDFEQFKKELSDYGVDLD